MTLAATSQTKPSGYVQLKTSDVRLLIESNEQGKRAQEQVPVLERKISVLQDNLGLSRSIIASKDSSLKDLEKSLELMYVVTENNNAIINNLEAEARIWEQNFNAAKKGERRAKRKTVFVGLTGLLISGTILYFAR